MKSLLVCFDYDGVLADTYDNVLNALTEAQRELGAGRPPRKGDLEVIEDLTFLGIGRHLEMTDAEAGRLAQIGFKLLQTHAAEAKLFPGVVEMLDSVASTAWVCVITANMAPVVSAALLSWKVDQRVDLIQGWETPGNKADKIRRAMDQFGVAPARSFMVGDSKGDIRQGKAAGVQTIAVGWGYQPVETLAREQPSAVAHTPAEIVAALTRLC